MTNADPIGSIYLTYKARMVAETRLRHMDMISQLVVGWYSFCIIAISLLDLSQTFKVRDVSIMTAILSIAVLAVSIFLAGQRYDARATAYRECYLKLQKLYRSKLPNDEKLKIYGDALDLYENHLTRDHEVVLFHSWISGKKLRDAEGDITITAVIIAKVAVRYLLNITMLLAVFLLPLVFGYILLIRRGAEI